MKLPNGPADWEEMPLENHVRMTFEYPEGQSGKTVSEKPENAEFGHARTGCHDAQ